MLFGQERCGLVYQCNRRYSQTSGLASSYFKVTLMWQDVNTSTNFPRTMSKAGIITLLGKASLQQDLSNHSGVQSNLVYPGSVGQGVPVTSKLPVSLNMLFITSLTINKCYLACYNKVQIQYTFL